MPKRGRAGGLVPKQKTSLPPLPTYKTVQDHPRMGLNNKICKSPVAFCKSKQVFLSLEDIAAKCCMCKPTLDMIGTEVCKKLEPIERN